MCWSNLLFPSLSNCFCLMFSVSFSSYRFLCRLLRLLCIVLLPVALPILVDYILLHHFSSFALFPSVLPLLWFVQSLLLLFLFFLILSRHSLMNSIITSSSCLSSIPLSPFINSTILFSVLSSFYSISCEMLLLMLSCVTFILFIYLFIPSAVIFSFFHFFFLSLVFFWYNFI